MAAHPNKSFGSLVESSFTAQDGYNLPTFWADELVGNAVYGNETWVIPGTVCRLRVFARGKGNIRIWGKTGAQFTQSALVTLPVNSGVMKEYITPSFTIPQGVTGIVDAYEYMKEFTPVQMWIGTHVPPYPPAWRVGCYQGLFVLCRTFRSAAPCESFINSRGSLVKHGLCSPSH